MELEATTATLPLSQASCFSLLRWAEKGEGGRRDETVEVASAVTLGKLTVLIVRKGWATTIKYKLHSTTAFRASGVYRSSAISFTKLEDNGKLVSYGTEAAGF